MPGRNFGVQKRDAQARVSTVRESIVNPQSRRRIAIKAFLGLVLGKYAAMYAIHYADASVVWITDRLPGWVEPWIGKAWGML
jgi:hypothetical protein